MASQRHRGHHRHHVVVVGAGFGGLAVVKSLAEAPVDVTLVDGRNHHTFQPLLYQVATAGLDGDDICFPVRGILARQANARVRMGSVTGIDRDARTLTLADGAVITYDDLVLAAGSVSNTYSIPGVQEHAFGLKSLIDALDLRSHVLRCFEWADADPAHRGDGTMSIVVVGGGPSGVEMAGGLMELISHVVSKDHPGLDMRPARVVLVEAGDRLLAAMHPKLSANALSTLTSKGVEVMLGRSVHSASADSVRVQDRDGTPQVIPSRTMVWTAGVKANPLAEALGVELTKGARVVVEPDLSVPGHAEIHVVGDMAASLDEQGNPLPQVAQVAIQGGRCVARGILERTSGPAEESPGSGAAPFRYTDKGSMATIGRRDAVAQLPGGVRLAGTVGWFAWLLLHLVMLLGFRNRLNVLVNWAWNYLTYDQASRLIAERPDNPGIPGTRTQDPADPENAPASP